MESSGFRFITRIQLPHSFHLTLIILIEVFIGITEVALQTEGPGCFQGTKGRDSAIRILGLPLLNPCVCYPPENASPASQL